ncbi:MAG: PSD1 and planctomycete cytochrome C domain-containing protein [Planctomycetota bacterium]
MVTRFALPFFLAIVFAPFAASDESSEIEFVRDIRPILSNACFECHGPDQSTLAAGLRLDLAASASSVVESGDPEASELIRRILSEDPDERMPPPESPRQLNDDQRQALVKWVRQGAEFSQHWSLIPPQPSVVPELSYDDWSRDPLDRFVLRRLREEQKEPSKRAAAETLARRITLDLTGLPPTTEQIDRFLQEDLDVAIDRMIDRLMQSPRYAEHMAVPWLEAARYADTDGYQNDRYRYQHVWRDWVIDAFRMHKPYDQFVVEQIAGDMLPDATLRQQIATGFGRNHRINSEDGSIPEEWRTEYVADRVDTFGTLFLGLTVSCARCHDHKYDPISQQEYYQLFAYFNNIAEWGVGPNNGNSPPFIEVPKTWPLISPGENQLIQPEPVNLRRARKDAGNGLQRPQAGSPSTVMVMHELDKPRETFVLSRGQYNLPDRSRPVSASVPRSLATAESDRQPGNRLELAQWLFHPDHPLTARVAVNRIWQQFFGTGLVETSDNFGSQGALPSHPELLDYLALEFIRSGWDIQAIQRRILRSATYQQSSVISDDAIQWDPDNRFLARGPRYRLPGFVVRDQALLLSGMLVEQVGGPSTKPYMPPKIWSAISNNRYKQDKGSNLYRRSLYTYWRRTIPPPTMMSFNAAAREVCSVQTESTNTPLQALTLMNNKTFIESSRLFAERLLRLDETLASKLHKGFREATGRIPNDAESAILLETYGRVLQHFESNPSAAKELLSVGEQEPDGSLPIHEYAAMTMTASIILNLDETISKE